MCIYYLPPCWLSTGENTNPLLPNETLLAQSDPHVVSQSLSVRFVGLNSVWASQKLLLKYQPDSERFHLDLMNSSDQLAL